MAETSETRFDRRRDSSASRSDSGTADTEALSSSSLRASSSLGTLNGSGTTDGGGGGAEGRRLLLLARVGIEPSSGAAGKAFSPSSIWIPSWFSDIGVSGSSCSIASSFKTRIVTLAPGSGLLVTDRVNPVFGTLSFSTLSFP